MRIGAITGTVILIVAWFIVTTTGLVNPLFLPSPPAVFMKLVALARSGPIWVDLYATTWRTLLGYALGCSLGVPIGLLMGRYRRIYQTMEFPVDFFRSIPASALFPLFIVIWGLGDQVQVFIAVWASSMVVLINTMYGVRGGSPIRLRVAKTKKLSPMKTFYKVTLPDALPYIIAGARIGLSFAIIVEIVAEMFLGVHHGLGRRIFNATSIFQMEEAYATIFVVGLLGYLMNKTIIIIEKRAVHWAGK